MSPLSLVVIRILCTLAVIQPDFQQPKEPRKLTQPLCFPLFVGVVGIHYDHVYKDSKSPASGTFIEKIKLTSISIPKAGHAHLLSVESVYYSVWGSLFSKSQRTLAEECRVGVKCQIFPLLIQIT